MEIIQIASGEFSAPIRRVDVIQHLDILNVIISLNQREVGTCGSTSARNHRKAAVQRGVGVQKVVIVALGAGVALGSPQHQIAAMRFDAVQQQIGI